MAIDQHVGSATGTAKGAVEMDFFAIVKGDGPVSDAEGLGVFDILAPVVMAAPDDTEAVGAATSTIARMSRE